MSIRKEKKIYAFRKNVLLSIVVTTLSLILVGSIAADGGRYSAINLAYAVKQFKVNVSIDKDPIQRGDTQKIKVTVRDADTNDRVSNAFVKLKVESPSGDSDTGSSHTNNNGETTFKLKISSHGDTGTYDVTIKVSKDGYKTKSSNDSFKVTSGHNNNGNSGNNGGGGSNTNNKHKQTQSIAQANVCGNGNLPLNVKCQNLANQVQGSGNSVNIIGVQ